MVKSKCTIKDVAKYAGVSVSTVSRVFNNYGDISDATISKVLEAATKLDYIPNQAARNLSTKNKKIIALILNNLKVEQGVTMPFEILSCVSHVINNTDYEFVFYATTTEMQKEKSLKQFCSEHSITGVIIQGLRLTDAYYKELEEFDLPLVTIDLRITSDDIASISIDNELASTDVTQRLVDRGYKNIIMLNGTEFDEISQLREKGYKSIVQDPKIIYANFSEEEAYSKIEKLLEIQSFDAIFAASDLMAIGALRALKDRGLNKMIAVVGFDDIALARYVSPSLTTVRQDIQKIAEQSVFDLMNQIESHTKISRFIPFEIIVRESADI